MIKTVVPAKAGTHTPCPLDRLRSMGPGSCLRSAGTICLRGTVTATTPFHYRIEQGTTMVIGIAHLQPIVALVAGILILIIPRLLNIIVAVYLIFIGVIGLFPNLLH
jgi:hypothetical protein